MRAAFSTGPGHIALHEVQTPTPAAGEAIIKVRNCGVCGSDLHWYHGTLPAPAVCPGHEISGEVAAVGAGVKTVKAGDRVAVEPLVVCGECTMCHIGEYQLCRNLRILGTMLDGGFADYVRAPSGALFPLAPEVDWDLGALTEPMAVCVHAVRLANVQLGQRVLVLGAGTIGLLSVVAARAAGATEVLITARHPHQRAVAEALGGRAFAATDEGAAELGRYARKHPIDVVIETVGGMADTLTQAIQLVRGGGTVVVLGVFNGPISCSGLLLVTKEVRIIGSLTYSRTDGRPDFQIALDLLAAQRDQLRQLITHRYPLERISEAFTVAGDKTSGAIKVTVSG